MAELEVLVGVSVRPWADALHAFCADHGGARVRGRVMDEDGAVGQAADVVFLDDTASFLSGRLVDRLHQRGTSVVVVAEAAQLASVREWVSRMGVDAVVSDDEPPDRLVTIGASTARPRERTQHVPAAPVAETAHARVVLVAGVSGGVGATEVTLGLATALAGSGVAPVVMDLDLGSPSIAQRLGLPLHPNLRSALAAHRSGQPLDEHLGVIGGVRVLVGPTSAGEWSGMETHDLGRLVDDLARGATVVVNLPAGPPRPHPHGALSVADVTRALLPRADTVVAVSLPTPVGVARTIEWLAAVDGLLPDRTHVVFNRAPRSAFRRSEARVELGVVLEASVQFVPDDPIVGRAAWAGEPIGRGPFRRAMRRMVEVVA